VLLSAQRRVRVRVGGHAERGHFVHGLCLRRRGHRQILVRLRVPAALHVVRVESVPGRRVRVRVAGEVRGAEHLRRRVEAARARGVGAAGRARVVPDGVLHVGPVVEEVVTVDVRHRLLVRAPQELSPGDNLILRRGRERSTVPVKINDSIHFER
jgi:hypothetical protein